MNIFGGNDEIYEEFHKSMIEDYKLKNEKQKEKIENLNRKDLIYMDIAKDVSRFSHAKRRKVGCLILSKNGKILGTGYNGTPQGTDNSCEDENNITYGHVIHAEENAVLNSEKTNLKGASVYVTLSPCVHCASVLVQKKVKRVLYSEQYRDLSGVEYLIKNGVEVKQIKI